MVNAIDINNASFGYFRKGTAIPVLNSVSLSLAKGELVGIAGLNGSGKSTFLKTLAGLLPKLNGEILINGQNVESISQKDLAKELSIVLTEKISGFNLTAYDVVSAGRLPYTGPFHNLNAADEAIISEAIHQCGLEDHQNKLLTELSDGLYQKSMIAKCLAQKSSVMLLDEPGAFLDYASKHELFKLLSEKCTMGNCILISSHDLEMLLRYCQKIILVADYKMEMIPVEEVAGHKIFKQLSGGYL